MGDIMKKVKCVIKRVIYAAVLLYGYNLISTQFNMMIPINIYNLGIVSLLGTSGFILLILFKYLIL
jgi:pro-sigmaK processing inhibitor BofA